MVFQVYTGCFAGWDLFQRMIRTFGIGPRVKKSMFSRLGWDLRPKTTTNPCGSVKTMCDVLGSVDGHIVPKSESVFDNFLNVSSFFFLCSFSWCFAVLTPQHTQHTAPACVCLFFFVFYTCCCGVVVVLLRCCVALRGVVSVLLCVCLCVFVCFLESA